MNRAAAPDRIRQAALLWDNPKSRTLLRREVVSIRPEVLLFHNLIPVASLGLYEEARRLDLPVVQYIHNFRPFSPSGTLWMKARVVDSALRGNPAKPITARIEYPWELSIHKMSIAARCCFADHAHRPHSSLKA